MMKHLLIFLFALPMMLVGCSSSEQNARNKISSRLDANKKENVTYSIGKCIYSEDNDSCFIFQGNIANSNGNKQNTEYIYKQREDGLFICIKFVDANGSLLRNINKKSNTGNATVDDAVNSAMESSKLGLSLTIYNDLLNGSLVGIPESK